jgi:hypothetical protein
MGVLMPNLTVKEVSTIVRQYFDDIKKSKFIFDMVRVEYDEREENWEIECEVSNVFQEEPRHYTIHVDDEEGEILDVSEDEED